MAKDYYQTLGVGKSASAEEIKRAYRKLAHQHHPDKGGGNEAKFKEVNEAYQVLSDEGRRQKYDQFGENFEQAGGFPGGGQGFEGFQGFGGFNGSADFDIGDIFGDIFGVGQDRQSRRTRGVDLELGLELSFEEAVFGTTKRIRLEKMDRCEACSGSGAEPGTKVATCPKCHGQGHIKTVRRTVFGAMESRTTCDRCDGTGKVPEQPCRTCKGAGVKRREKIVEVTVPAGIDDGQRIRVTGEGEAGYRGSEPGDLYLQVRVRTHPKFVRDGSDLRLELPVSFVQAALGAKLSVETLDGSVELKVPAGTQPGTVLKLRGKGVPHLRGSGRGDLLATVRAVVPTKLSKKEKQVLHELAKERGESVEVDESLWDSIKDTLR